MTAMSNIPFADPLWLTRRASPYYDDSHRALQKEVRAYVDTHIAPFCDEWEKNGLVPKEVHPNNSQPPSSTSNFNTTWL